jgi:hypothetical protein
MLEPRGLPPHLGYRDVGVQDTRPSRMTAGLKRRYGDGTIPSSHSPATVISLLSARASAASPGQYHHTDSGADAHPSATATRSDTRHGPVDFEADQEERRSPVARNPTLDLNLKRGDALARIIVSGWTPACPPGASAPAGQQADLTDLTKPSPPHPLSKSTPQSQNRKVQT